MRLLYAHKDTLCTYMHRQFLAASIGFDLSFYTLFDFLNDIYYFYNKCEEV